MKHPDRNPATRFGRNLHAELVARDVSVRELARRMNPGGTEQAVETTRRHLSKMLSPNEAMAVNPRPKMVARIADALGVDPDTIADTEREEAELMAQLVRVLERMPLNKVVDALEARAAVEIRLGGRP